MGRGEAPNRRDAEKLLLLDMVDVGAEFEAFEGLARPVDPADRQPPSVLFVVDLEEEAVPTQIELDLFLVLVALEGARLVQVVDQVGSLPDAASVIVAQPELRIHRGRRLDVDQRVDRDVVFRRDRLVPFEEHRRILVRRFRQLPFDVALLARVLLPEIDLGKKYAGKKGDVKWEMSKPSYKNSTVLFEWDKTVTPKDNVAVYTLIYVKPPSAMDAQLWLGHDAGCRVWQGTNLIHNLDKAGSLKGDEHKEKIKLDLGWNRFLFKVYNKKDAWGLAVRWVDGSGKQIGRAHVE